MASLGLCVAFIYYDRKNSSGCQNYNLRVQRKNFGNFFCRECFFQTFSEFEQRNLETVKHGFKNCSLRVHRNNFRKFSGARKIRWNFSFFQRKDRISRENFLRRLPKAHFTCPLQNFEKKSIKVNIAACGFFRTSCDFFTVTEKLALGVKTTN